MANINNYQTDLVNAASKYRKYTVSRVVSSTKNQLLDTEIPANIPEKFTLDIALYSLADNSLIFHAIYPSTYDANLESPDQTPFEIRNLIYSDGTVRRLLFINFKNIGIVEVDGVYEMVINFFVDEFGDYTSPPLYLTRISPSRTEIEMKLVPEMQTPMSASKLQSYIYPQISNEWVLDIFKQLCNQPKYPVLRDNEVFVISADTPERPDPPTDNTMLSYDIVQEFLPVSESRKILDPSTPGVYTASIKQDVQVILDMTYNYVTASVNQQKLLGTTFTNDVIYSIFSSSMTNALKQYTKQYTKAGRDSKNYVFV